MAYQENQTPRFSRLYKKLSKHQLSALHDVMDVVLKNPKTGTKKVGDLSTLFVYKFKIGKEEWLLGYTFNANNVLTWHAIGQHQNFYRDVTRGNKA